MAEIEVGGTPTASTKEQEFLICKCSNTEHIVVFTWWADAVYEEVYMDIHLKPLGFWERLKHAVKYVFGYRSRFGDFDSIIIREEDAPKLEKIVEYLKKKQ